MDTVIFADPQSPEPYLQVCIHGNIRHTRVKIDVLTDIY